MRKRVCGVSIRKNDFLIVLSWADKLKKFLLEYEVEGARKFEPILVSLPVPRLRQAHHYDIFARFAVLCHTFQCCAAIAREIVLPPLALDELYTRVSRDRTRTARDCEPVYARHRGRRARR